MSTITLKTNKKPHFSKVVFECDKPINKKLDKYELTKDFLNCANTTAYVGTQGSGKTSLAISQVKTIYKKCFHHIYLFMPPTSRGSLKDNIFEKHLDVANLYDDLNEITIADVNMKLEANTAKKEWSLIIFDDVQKNLKNNGVLLSLQNLIANMRHLRCVNIILLQNWFACPKSMRELMTNVIIFKLGKSQTNKIFEEVIESEKEHFNEIRKFVYDKPKQYLFVNIATQKMFKGFDEIIIHNKDDDDSDIEL